MEMLIAFLDLVPTAIFLWTTIILFRDLYHMMSRTAYAFFSAGNLMIFVAGLYKCIWKILMYLKVCDFTVLNTSFFLIQSTGFLLGGIGILLMFRKENAAAAATVLVPVYSSSMLFVAFTLAGLFMGRLGLVAVARKMGRKAAAWALILSLPVMMGMGYLSAKDFSQPVWNLYAELVNMLGQTLLLVAVYDMDRAGLRTLDMGGNGHA